MDSSSQLSRRKFLKTTTLGGATLAAAPAWGRVLGANDRINVALIGVGCRGNDHLELLLQHRRNKPDIEIVAICDTYQKRLGMALRKAPGAKTYVHHQEVLQRTDIDAVFIATPDHWHAPITLAAMESGKDVYVEKPMTHTVEESKVVAHRAKDQTGSAGRSAGNLLDTLAQDSRHHPIGDDRSGGGRAGHLQPQCSRRRLEHRRVVADRSRRRARTRPATTTSIGSNGSAPLPSCPSMPTASSASANTGTTRAASPPICITMSWRPSMLRWPTIFRARGRHGRTLGL